MLGIDGAPFSVLEAYAHEHPNGLISQVLANGHVRPLLSTLPYFTAPGWTTFMTGLEPGQHGIYHWRGRFDPVAGTRPLMSSRHLAEASVWWYCQQHGARVSVSNFPMEYPAPATDGRYICGTLAPEDAADVTWPPQLIDDIKKAMPDYRFEMDKGLSYRDQPVRLREHILGGGECHAAAARMFGAAESVDLLFHVVTITDRMQHFFWHCFDAAHPEHSSAVVELVGNPILESYALADRFLEELWNSGRWDNLLIVSDHGGGPSTLAFHTDVWLAEHGYLRFSENGTVDICHSLAYSGEEPECAIYVNRQDRDGMGVPIAEYPEFLKRLQRELSAVVIPGTSTLVFRDIHVQSDLYAGPHSTIGPDLVLVPGESIHPRPGRNGSVFDRATRLYGAHRREGIFLAYGKSVAPSKLSDGLPHLHLRDMFPLICALMEIPVPGGLSGRLPEEVLAETCAPPTYDRRWDWQKQVRGAPIPQRETPKMLDRLAELGYL